MAKISNEASDPLYPVVKYLRNNVKVGSAIVEGKRVDYFIGKYMLKCLLDSKFCSIPSKTSSDPSTTKSTGNEKDVLFHSRAECEALIIKLLSSGSYFHSASFPATMKKRPSLKSSKPVYLSIDPHQSAVWDLEQPYVWILSAESWLHLSLGILILVLVIACCMMPLWPPQLLLGVRYISMGFLGIVAVFFAFAFARVILFALIWIATLGKFHFWLYPMLLESEGFWDSFVPVYTAEWQTKPAKSEPKSKSEDKSDVETSDFEQIDDCSSKDDATKKND